MEVAIGVPVETDALVTPRTVVRDPENELLLCGSGAVVGTYREALELAEMLAEANLVDCVDVLVADQKDPVTEEKRRKVECNLRANCAYVETPNF